MGELVLLCESRTMSCKMCSSVRVLLCDAGEMSSAVLNLRQAGGGMRRLKCTGSVAGVEFRSVAG